MKPAQLVCKWWKYCCRNVGLKILSVYGNNNETLFGSFLFRRFVVLVRDLCAILLISAVIMQSGDSLCFADNHSHSGRREVGHWHWNAGYRGHRNWARGRRCRLQRSSSPTLPVRVSCTWHLCGGTGTGVAQVTAETAAGASETGELSDGCSTAATCGASSEADASCPVVGHVWTAAGSTACPSSSEHGPQSSAADTVQSPAAAAGGGW